MAAPIGAAYSGHKGKGYEVQVAETCEEENAVEIITHVEVTPSCASDASATLPVIESLAARGIQPPELVVDTAYGSGKNAVAAERMGTELVSPVAGSAAASALGASPNEEERRLTAGDFTIDASGAVETICPAGHASVEEFEDRVSPDRVHIVFEKPTCEACPLRKRCPVQPDAEGPGYVLLADLVKANIESRRLAEARGEFKPRYAIRAGIEATNSELKRGHGLGRLRVRGRARVELAVYVKALACNVKRMLRALMAADAAPVLAVA